MLNLDANASLGMKAGLLEQVSDLLGEFCNPSAIHRGGQRARYLLEEARGHLRVFLGAAPQDQVIFTSGATEANNLAINAIGFQSLSEKSNAPAILVASDIEHHSVLEPILRWGGYGCAVRLVPVATLREACSSVQARQRWVDELSEPRLVAFMAANNETGEVFATTEVFAALRAKFPRVRIHSDAVQLVGKQVFNWGDLGCDSMSLSGHKLGALPGVGALVVKAGIEPSPLLLGGPQESRWRAGTENLPGIVSLGLVAASLGQSTKARARRMLEARQYLERSLSTIAGVAVNFTSLTERLPNTLSVTVSGVRADDLVVALDLRGVCISSGAACASGKPEGSHVLKAYGLTDEQVAQTVRISVTGEETIEQLNLVVDSLRSVVERMRQV